jgi:hypothetical protein
MAGLLLLLLVVSGCAALNAVLDADPLVREQPTMKFSTQTMFDFSRPETVKPWFRVNDGVMGGVSESQLVATDRGTAVFSGNISFKNNGGFATVQADFSPPLDLSQFIGLELRLLGDGKRYGVYLRNNRAVLAYQAVFDTTNGEWLTVRLPFSSFQAISYGRPVNAAPLDSSQVRSMSLIIEYKQEGPFALELAQIGAYIE